MGADHFLIPPQAIPCESGESGLSARLRAAGFESMCGLAESGRFIQKFRGRLQDSRGARRGLSALASHGDESGSVRPRERLVIMIAKAGVL